jgi:AraC-like DNA-binding protein
MSSIDAFVPRRCTSADRMMWVTPSRIFYAGLLGAPVMHAKGALVIYVAIEAPLRIRIDGGDWATTEVAVIQPFVPYEIVCDGRHVLDVIVEPETVRMDQLPPVLRACGAVEAPELAARIRGAHARLVAAGRTIDLRPEDFDTTFFGAPMPARALDPRIAAVLDQIRNNSLAVNAAAECAARAGLSLSRFLHLFKEQVGAPFRSFRTWKRARSLLHYVDSRRSLVDVALDIGYPDSTHFSHSIRQLYGLKPRDIFAGSRKLKVTADRPRGFGMPANN